MQGNSLIEMLVSLLLISLSIIVALTTQLKATALIAASYQQAVAAILLSDGWQYKQVDINLAPWQKNVAAKLPQAQATVEQAAAYMQLTVRWYDKYRDNFQQLSIEVMS